MSLAMIPGNENHLCAALSLFAVLVTFDARKIEVDVGVCTDI